MSNNGINFGSHTHTHAKLTAIKQSEIEKEIAISKDIIEGILNKKVEHLSYPLGEYNETVKDILRKMGFKPGWAVRPYNVKSGMNLYNLFRKGGADVSLERFKLIISNYEKWVFYLRKLYKKRVLILEDWQGRRKDCLEKKTIKSIAGKI